MTDYDGPTLRLTFESSDAGPGWPSESISLAVSTKKNDADLDARHLGALLARLASAAIYRPNDSLSLVADGFIEELCMHGQDCYLRAYNALRRVFDRREWGPASDDALDALIAELDAMWPRPKSAGS